MARLNFSSRLGVSRNTTFDAPHKYVTSPFFLRRPLVFAAARMTVAFYTLTTLLVTLIWGAVITHDVDSFFSFFTHLTYIGICAYYFASGTQTLSYALNWRRGGDGAGYPLQRWGKWLQGLHVVLQSTICTFPIIVTIVFWALLSSPATFANSFSSWSNISVHAFNTVFALFEIFFSNSPPLPWITLPINLVLLASYLGVAYITHVTQGFYPYSFLDPKQQGPKLAAYIIGIAVADFIVFAVVRGLMVLRQRWAVRSRRVLSLDDIRSENGGWGGEVGGAREDIEEGWEEVESPTSVSSKRGRDSGVSKTALSA